MYGGKRFQIHETLVRLHETIVDVGLTVNSTKTAAIKQCFDLPLRVVEGHMLKLGVTSTCDPLHSGRIHRKGRRILLGAM